MKQKFLIIVTAAFWLIAVDVLAVSIVCIDGLGGGETKVGISNLQQIKFTRDSLFLIGEDGSDFGNFAKAECQRIVFSLQEDTVIPGPLPPDSIQSDTIMPSSEHNVIDSPILIYPLPSSDVMFIKGLNDHTHLSLFDLQGRVLYRKRVNGPQVVLSVAHLTNGIYILQINSETFKIIKQ